MEERNRSDAIPLPKWGSFQIESNEPGRDFPAGPYNRMIAKLYGTGGGPLEYADIYRPANTSSRLGLANGQAVLPVSEGRMDKTPVTSFSGGQLMHKTRQEDEPSRFGPAVAQHTEGSRQDDRMIAKLHGTGGKPLEYIGKSRMDNTSSVLGLADGQPMPSVLEGMMDKTPVKSFSGDRLMHKTRQEDEPSRFGPAVAQHSEGSRQDDRMIAKSHGTVSKPLEYIDTSRMDNTSSRLGSVDGQPVPPVSEGRMDKTPIRSFSGGQLMHKTNQEERPSRFGPAVTQHTEGSRHDNEPVRSGSVEPDNEPVRSGPVEPEHLADKTKMDIGLVQSGTGDDHPADKVYATVVSAAGQSKDLDDKVKWWDGAPAGVIFMCNKITKQICFHYGVFGLPAIQLKLVQRIVPGTKLFLFVLESRELHGIFEASSNGGFNLEPFAFGPSFPSQVRFRICRPCRPLMEKDFRKAIEDNYFQHNKFKNELSSQQVLNLLQLFCPEGFLDEKEQKHENLMPNHTHARGKKDRPVSDPAHSQSDLSMEISSQDPQSSPAVDSRQSQYSMLFKGSHMGAQLSVMDASRDYRPPKDDPAVRGQDPMGDQIRMRGLHSIPIEGSRHYYSPSVDGPMLSKSPYMDVMGGSQKSLTEETRLVQPSLDRFQRDSTVFSREASGESHQPMVDVRSRALGKTPIEGGHDIYADKRHYISSSSVANGSYSLDANDNYRKSSLYSSGLQPYGSGAQCHMLSEQAEEKGNFPVKDNLQDSMHRSYAPNTGLQSWDGGVSGQRFSDADVERGKFLSHDYLKASDHISRSQLWPRAEVTGRSIEQNMFLQSNPNEREIYTNESDGLRQEQAERLARIDHMYKQDQQRSQENIVFNDSRDLQGGWVDASSFRSHKRVSEDPVDDASNPVKRQHYYNESLGDRMSDGQARSVNGASLGGDWMGNASWAGSNMGKS